MSHAQRKVHAKLFSWFSLIKWPFPKREIFFPFICIEICDFTICFSSLKEFSHNILSYYGYEQYQRITILVVRKGVLPRMDLTGMCVPE